MFFFFCVCFIAYVGYKYVKRNESIPERSSRNQFFTTRSDLRGAVGERTIQADLKLILNDICGDDFYLSPGPLLLNHAPGTEFPTAEVDHLAITPFGIFLVETKHWSGRIQASASDDRLVRISPDGTREERRSPLTQNRSKVAFVRRLLPPHWPVRGVGIFSAENVQLESTLPLDLIRRDEVFHWLRRQQAAYPKNGTAPLRIDIATKAILAHGDTSAEGLRNHIERTSEDRSV